jgi:hypothetical protein
VRDDAHLFLQFWLKKKITGVELMTRLVRAEVNGVADLTGVLKLKLAILVLAFLED